LTGHALRGAARTERFEDFVMTEGFADHVHGLLSGEEPTGL
jgi:hypothetical protein